MLAVIGGSGLNQLSTIKVIEEKVLSTPYGEAAVLRRVLVEDEFEILFLPRHGDGHKMPPHLINYRANIWALKNQGATVIVAVNAVGGIRDDMGPGTLVVPNQIIDYTYGREHTFFTGGETGVEHIDFTQPFHAASRNWITTVARSLGVPIVSDGVYGCCQGPRLETAAEILKLKKDGCDLVGMTGMPEAALAKELNLKYAAINLVVNWGAGLSNDPITMDGILEELQLGMDTVNLIVQKLAQSALPR